MAWTKDNGKQAKIAAEMALHAGSEAQVQAERASLGADYIDEKKPLIEEFTGEQTNLQAQLDALVVDGDSSPEAAQARVGTDATAYATLKARLDAEQKKVTTQLADTAKKSEVTNALAPKADKVYVDTKVAAIDTKVNSQASGSPKGVYPTLTDLQSAFPTGNGNVYVVTADKNWYYWNGTAWTAGAVYLGTGDATNFPATNIVVNGNFSSGTTGWTASGSTISATNNTLSSKGTSNPTARVIKNTGVKPNVGDKLYFRGNHKVTNSLSTFLYFIIRDGESGAVLTQTAIPTPVINNVYTISGVHEVLNAMTNNLTLLIDHRYADAATALDKVMEIQWIQVINLTKTFGAGFEPTQAEFEALLDKYPNRYFEGTVTPIINSKDLVYNFPVKNIDNGIVTPQTTTFFEEKISSNNLFNPATITKGVYARYDNGAIATLAGYNATDHIKLEEGSTYIRKYGEQFAYYGANGVFVSGVSGNANLPFTVPIGVKTARFSIRDIQLADFQVNKGNSLAEYDTYATNFMMDSSLIYGLPLPGSSTPTDSPLLIVDKNGNGQFTSPTDAINHVKANYPNGNTVILSNGEYEEVLDLKQNPNISIVGINKKDCIIVDKSGDYVNSPLMISGNGYFKNLTFIANHDNNPTMEGVVNKSYAMHYDYTGEGTTIFEDCDFKSYQAPAVGIGMHSNQLLVFINCDFYKDSTYNGGCFYAHNAVAGNAVNQKIRLVNCRIVSKQGRAFSLTDANIGYGDGLGNDMEIEIINTMVYSEELGKESLYIGNAPTVTNGICGSIVLSRKSYGNNIADLNA